MLFVHSEEKKKGHANCHVLKRVFAKCDLYIRGCMCSTNFTSMAVWSFPVTLFIPSESGLSHFCKGRKKTQSSVPEITQCANAISFPTSFHIYMNYGFNIALGF
jgi:hypothetical protein